MELMELQKQDIKRRWRRPHQRRALQPNERLGKSKCESERRQGLPERRLKPARGGCVDGRRHDRSQDAERPRRLKRPARRNRQCSTQPIVRLRQGLTLRFVVDRVRLFRPFDVFLCTTPLL